METHRGGDKKRKLTLLEKVQLITHADRGKKQRELAQEFSVGLGTVHNILKKREEFMELYRKEGNIGQIKRRSPESKYSQINRIVLEWYLQYVHFYYNVELYHVPLIRFVFKYC